MCGQSERKSAMKKSPLPLIVSVLALTLFLSTGCGDSRPDAPDWRPIIIGEGDLKNIIGYEDSWIINKANQLDWSTLWKHTRNSQNVSVSDTLVDFDKDQILIVVEGMKGSPGYAISVAEVEEQESAIVVSIEHKSPKMPLPKEVTQPYCIAKLPQSSKPIVLVHEAFPPMIYGALIGRGILNGNGDIPRQDLLIQNQNDWIKLLTSMNIGSDVNLKEYFPKVNFEEFMVIGTFEKYDCQYPSCPNRYVDITDIIETETSIRVVVQNLYVVLTEGYPQPYHLVQIPKTSKPIMFEHK